MNIPQQFKNDYYYVKGLIESFAAEHTLEVEEVEQRLDKALAASKNLIPDVYFSGYTFITTNNKQEMITLNQFYYYLKVKEVLETASLLN